MNSDSNHHQQTTALKYLNAVFCSILVQGAQGFVVNENNIAMTGALTEASRISIPTEPYDFSLEKSVIQKFDEIKGEDENTETANSLEDNEAPVSASSGSPVNDTESNRNNAQSSPLTSALPFLIPPQENVLSSSKEIFEVKGAEARRYAGGPSVTMPSDDVAGTQNIIMFDEDSELPPLTKRRPSAHVIPRSPSITSIASVPDDEKDYLTKRRPSAHVIPRSPSITSIASVPDDEKDYLTKQRPSAHVIPRSPSNTSIASAPDDEKDYYTYGRTDTSTLSEDEEEGMPSNCESSQITNVSAMRLDKAYHWEAVAVAVALMNEGSVTSDSTQELRGISRLSEYESSDYSSATSTKSSIIVKKINSMIELGDWSGVVLAAKRMGKRSAKKAEKWKIRAKSSTKPQKKNDLCHDLCPWPCSW